jgi:hypothetical protein
MTAASGRMFDLSKSKFTPRSTIFSPSSMGAGAGDGAGRAGAGSTSATSSCCIALQMK